MPNKTMPLNILIILILNQIKMHEKTSFIA